jgi:hypothetical protein
MMRLNDHGGLSCTETTWALVVLLVVAWIGAPSIALVRRRGWRAMPTSLLGFVWLGFGIDFVLRFFLLALDSVEFGNDTFRLADLASSTVDAALVTALLYWGAFVLGFACWDEFRRPGVLAAVDVLGARGRLSRRYALLVGSTICSVLSSGLVTLPLAILTPIGIAGSLWVIPAALTWAEYAARPDDDELRRARWIVLAPALVRFLVSPFREHLLPIALIPLLAWRCARGRVPRKYLAVATSSLLLFLLAANATQAYRDVLWGGANLEHVVDSVTGDDQPTDLVVDPDPEWLVAVRRFHGLDSLLLTIDLVPSVFPFRDDAYLADPFVRGLVPRIFMPGKQLSDRGPEFASTIWAFDSGLESGAAIAPSMAGDLYHSGGRLAVVLGALTWGLLLGLVDRWKDALPAGGRVAVLMLLATQVVPSVERDFAHCVANLLQTLVVVGVAGGALSQLWRDATVRRRRPIVVEGAV